MTLRSPASTGTAPTLVVAGGVVGLAGVVLTAAAAARDPGLVALLAGGLAAVVVAYAVPRWACVVAAVVLLKWHPLPHVEAAVAPLRFADLLLLLWVAKQAAYVARRPVPALRRDQLLLLAFLGWALLSTLAVGAALTPLARLALYASLALAPAVPLRDVVLITRGVTAYALVELVVSLPQLAGGDLIGATVGDPHNFAVLLIAAAAPLLVGDRLVWPSLPVTLGRGVAALLLTGAVLTERRSVWLALAAMALIAVMPRVTPARAAATGVGLLVVGAAAYGPVSRAFGLLTNSASIRLESIRRSLVVARDEPVFGVGWGGLTSGDTDVVVAPDDVALGSTVGSAYNLYVNTLASTGAPGLVLLTLLLLDVWRLAALRDLGVFLFLSAFLVLSLVEMTFFPESLITLLFFVALHRLSATAGTRRTSGAAPARG